MRPDWNGSSDGGDELEVEPHCLRQVLLPVVHADAGFDAQVVNEDLVHGLT